MLDNLRNWNFRRLYFSIFDAYGQGEETHKKEVRVTRPSDLNVIFSSCLLQAWKSLEREISDVLKREDYDLSGRFWQRVENAMTFNQLVEAENQIGENCENKSKAQLEKFFGLSFI